MYIKNITDGKVIGIGDVYVLPGETREVPTAYEKSIALEAYEKMGMAKIVGKPKKEAKAGKPADESHNAIEEEETETEGYNVDTMSDEELAEKAIQLGINPASCKDVKALRTKVKRMLKTQ